MKILVSTTPLTIARDSDGRHRYIYRGQTVDVGALDPADAKRLLKLGFLAEYEPPAPEEIAEDSSTKEPTTIDEIIAAVGDDAEQAQAYLDAEQAKAKPRPKLVKALEDVIVAAQGDGS